MAFSFTGDLGCEYGAGVSCYTNKKGGPKQSFVGYMLYNRFWFHNDLFGLTVGGGQINNPGRYLVLLPPINGETAITAATNSPYFTENPGDPFKAWDSSVTFDYMPKQYITFRWEYDYRHASVCRGLAEAALRPRRKYRFSSILCMQQWQLFGSNGPWACGNGAVVPGFTPDLKNESFIDLSILVKF